MQVTDISDRITHLEFETRRDLASTFLRFQEHYESPKYRGKIFTLDEYREWYISQRGSFSYYEDWAGFNIPSRVLRPFYAGKFDPLSTQEQGLLDLFADRKHPYYIIGTAKDGDKRVAVHEVAHGLFYTNRRYKQEVLEALRNQDLSEIFSYLKDEGYHPSVFIDEAHAYLCEDFNHLKKHGISEQLRPLHKRLLAIYRSYTPI